MCCSGDVRRSSTLSTAASWRSTSSRGSCWAACGRTSGRRRTVTGSSGSSTSPTGPSSSSLSTSSSRRFWLLLLLLTIRRENADASCRVSVVSSLCPLHCTAIWANSLTSHVSFVCSRRHQGRDALALQVDVAHSQCCHQCSFGDKFWFLGLHLQRYVYKAVCLSYTFPMHARTHPRYTHTHTHARTHTHTHTRARTHAHTHIHTHAHWLYNYLLFLFMFHPCTLQETSY